MKTPAERNTSTPGRPAPFFAGEHNGNFFPPSPDRNAAPEISQLASPVVQRQPAAGSSVSGMSVSEKWDIVYREALRGAGDGIIMALAILLGILVIFAIVSAIIAALCPECVAIVAGYLSAVVWGATVGSWLAAALAAIGASAAITVLVREYQTVNQAVASAETVTDLETAGRNWGYRSGAALVELFTVLLGMVPGIRQQLARLARLLRPRGSGSLPPAAPPRAPATPPPVPAVPARVPAAPARVPAAPARAPVAPPRQATQTPSRRSSVVAAVQRAFTLASRRILRYSGRDIVVVNTSRGPQAFYRRTGLGGGRPEGHAGPQAGQWAPFDGIMARWFHKSRYYDNISPDNPLYGFGNEEFRAAGRWLDQQRLPRGEDVGETFGIVNEFLESLGCRLF